MDYGKIYRTNNPISITKNTQEQEIRETYRMKENKEYKRH